MKSLDARMCPDDYGRAKREVRIVIAIDEASTNETFIRHLCRFRLGVARKVQDSLGVREVRIVAGVFLVTTDSCISIRRTLSLPFATS